jgi:uncharacterized membrane protein YfcA
LSELVFLPAAGLVSSTLTAAIGFGGGPIIIAVLLIFVAPAEAIPLHGMVQLTANLTRFFLIWRHVAWPLVFRFALLLVPGGMLGMWVFQGLSERAIQMLIGVFILSTLAVREVRFVREREFPRWVFIPLGFVVGALAVTTGVVALFTGAFMLRKELSKEAINGTMAVFGALGHILKIAAFGWAGFDFVAALPLYFVMVPAVLLGVVLGRTLLMYFTESLFLTLFKVLMLVLCLKLVVWEGLVPLWN